MGKSTVTRERLRDYFEKYSKPLPVTTIAQQFHDVKLVTLSYHLQALVKEGFLDKPRRGVYQARPQYMSPEDKRKAVDHHIATNGSRIRSGQAWRPGMEPLTESVDPVMFAFLARCFGESIVDRMKSAGFTKADVRFVDSMLSSVYPLSGPQKAQCERASNHPSEPD